MRRIPWVLGLMFLVSGGLAQPLTEIDCTILGTGGGKFSASTHSINVALGQGVVGMSAATDHSLLHGVWPCSGRSPTDTPDELTPEGQSPAAVTALRLHSNIPNPFNPATEIHYDVPASAAPVSLRIYDAHGRMVRRLVVSDASPGRRSVAWNGLDDAGQPVASGVYYAVLIAKGERLTTKMTLLK